MSDEQSEQIDKEILRGTRYECRRDPEDPRFDLVTMRVANKTLTDPEQAASLSPVEKLDGIRARTRIAMWCTSVTAAFSGMLFPESGIMQMLGAVHSELRVRQLLELELEAEAQRVKEQATDDK